MVQLAADLWEKPSRQCLMFSLARQDGRLYLPKTVELDRIVEPTCLLMMTCRVVF